MIVEQRRPHQVLRQAREVGAVFNLNCAIVERPSCLAVGSPKDRRMPKHLGVREPLAIFIRLEFGQLSHVDAVPAAKGDQLPEIIISWSTP